jgi:uncharacterized membrane protein (DUF373 family)
MLGYLKKFERTVVGALIALMALVVVLATVDLGWNIVRNVVTPPFGLLGVDEILDIFGYFLIVLIGIELLGTMTAYFVEHIVHAEIVVEVAMIAVARKVIILDVKELSSLTVIAIAAILLAMAVAYLVIKRTHAVVQKLGGGDRADAAR